MMNLAYSKNSFHQDKVIDSHSIVNLDIQSIKNGLCIHTLEGLEIIRYRDILYCSSDSNYCIIYCKDGRKVMASKTLKSIAEKLPDQSFIRIHQSHIININSIKKVSQKNVTLDHKIELPLSKSKRKFLLQKMEEYYDHP